VKELWTEKYRPQAVGDYVFIDDRHRQQVSAWIKDGTIPHLMFSGGPGTGKTTLAKVLINELGVDEYDVLYANGSKEARKIEWVDKLISFCQTMPFGQFKVVLIDEADYMNPSSVQPAMRNLMEDYSHSVRFILTCNYPNKILPPIHSRCQHIAIPKTDHTEFTARAATVLVTEGGRVGSAIQNKNGSVDYGPMQINSCWLPMLQTYGYTQQQIQYDPCINVQVGTWILSKNIAQAATLWRGVGNYNSKKPNLNIRYQNKVAEVDHLLQSYLSSVPTTF
jgi:DNA polymerase III delta prime subunit